MHSHMYPRTRVTSFKETTKLAIYKQTKHKQEISISLSNFIMTLSTNILTEFLSDVVE